MSSDGARTVKAPRPSAVTLSCVFIAVTAFLTLTEVSSALLDWGTVTMQDGLKPLLKQLADAGVDITMADLLGYLRWFALAMVPFAVSTMVFAIYAIRGDRTARVMTTILAIVAGIVSLPIGVFGIIQAMMMFLAAGALWTSDASRWFRGEPALTAVEPPTAGPSAEGADLALPPPPAQSVTGRPTSVMTAGLVTIVGSMAAAAFSAIYLLVYTFARDEYIKAASTGPFRDMVPARDLELMMQVTFWTSVAILPLAVVGIVAGLALLARRRAGRIATLLWAWATVAFSLVMLPLGLLGIAVIVLLHRDDARAWTTAAD